MKDNVRNALSIVKFQIMAWQNFWYRIRENWLEVMMLTSVVLGVILGIVLLQFKTFNSHEKIYVGFLGSIFLRMLRGVCIPLITSCIIISLATLEVKFARIIGALLLLHILVTKVFIVLFTLLVVAFAKPGSHAGRYTMQSSEIKQFEVTTNRETTDCFLDILRNVFPENMVGIAVQTSVTEIVKDNEGKRIFKEYQIEEVNVIGLLTFSIVFGVALYKLGQDNKLIVDIIYELNQITLLILKMILSISPVLLISLTADYIIEYDFYRFLSTTYIYMIVACCILLFQFLIIFPLLIFFLGRSNPITLYWGCFKTLATAFATSSSLSTVPITIETLSDMGFDSNAVSLIIPFSLFTSKDGTTMHLCISSVFLAQCERKHLNMLSYLFIGSFATLTSLCVPGLPFAHLTSLVTILNVLGVPTNHIVNIMVVEVLVDRIATLVNVGGATTAACVINECIQKRKEKEEKKEEEPEIYPDEEQ